MSEDERPQEQPEWEPDEELQPNPEHLAILKSGVDKWNAWRQEYPHTVPQLRYANLQGAHLPKVNSHEADLARADLQNSDLTTANLQQATLTEANLQKAELEGANLQRADLQRANLRMADLRWARLEDANLQTAAMEQANMMGAELEGASLLAANLDEANLEGADLKGAVFESASIAGSNLSYARVEGTSFRGVSWRPKGGGRPDPDLYTSFDVRGLQHSDPLFDEFVSESESIRRTYEATRRSAMGRFLFRMWGLTSDYGRGLGRWLFACCLVMGFFAALFSVCDFCVRTPIVSLKHGRTPTPLTHLYFSVVTFSTLGFGDVTPCHWAGELAVMIEVFIGYLMLGWLVSQLGARFGSFR